MKQIKKLSKILKASFLFIGLAAVLVLPGMMRCSGSVDIPDNRSSASNIG